MVDESREGGGKVVGRDVGSGKSGGEVVRWDVGSGKSGSGGRCCRVSWDGGVEVCMMGRDDGSLLSDGDGVRGRIILTFFLTRLESRGICGF